MKHTPHQHGPECKQVFALLSEYMDRELPAADCAEIDEHIADCPPCIEFLKSLRSSVALCRDCQPAEKPAPLAPEVKQKLFESWRKAVGGREQR